MSHSTRGCALPDPQLAGTGQVPPDDRLRELARYILEERERRRWHFPRAVFDEIPWEMLLLLYASESSRFSKPALMNAMLVAPEVLDRWTEYLEREGLVGRSLDPEGVPVVQLTPGGLSSLELYLIDRMQRAEAIDPNTRSELGAGLPGWTVGLLMLGTAVLSGAVTWRLVAT